MRKLHIFLIALHLSDTDSVIIYSRSWPLSFPYLPYVQIPVMLKFYISAMLHETTSNLYIYDSLLEMVVKVLAVCL